MPLFELSSLNCLYLFLLMLGVIYARPAMVAGGLHSLHLPLDVDLHNVSLHLPGHVDLTGVPSHTVSVLSLSPISMAAFVTPFGIMGIMGTRIFYTSETGSRS